MPVPQSSLFEDRPRGRRRTALALAAVGLILGTASLAMAQEPAASAPAAAPPAAPWLGNLDTGSTTWLLVSSAFVFLMMPGLAMFYGGMVRAKNVLNIMMCCMVAIGVIGLQWVLVGYGLAFGATSWHGLVSFDTSRYFMGFFDAANFGSQATSGDTTNAVSTGVPELAFMAFQAKFAIITPALIVGALAERVKFSGFVVFMLVWATLVYDPVAHWVWNVNGWLFQMGVLDFAGGTVVHVLAGVSALALCLLIGKRKGQGERPMLPHSLGLTLLGAGVLWFGWFGFNAGSAIALPGSELPVAGTVAALAFTNTFIAASAAATAWMLVEWLHVGKPTSLGFASGMVAGLVVITPCAGHVLPMWAIVIGLAGGVVCYGGVQLKAIFKYDDSLDAFGVHGVGGALGAILVGVFAFRPTVEGAATGLIYGGGQVKLQLIGVGAAALYAFVMTLVIGVIVHKTIGLRVSEEDEAVGLDVRLHGEEGYRLVA